MEVGEGCREWVQVCYEMSFFVAGGRRGGKSSARDTGKPDKVSEEELWRGGEGFRGGVKGCYEVRVLVARGRREERVK